MHFYFLSGPRRAKKVLFLFLQKLFWHFYSISRSCSCTCFTEYKELNLDAVVVNRWSYIIISEKTLFLEHFLLSYHLLLLLSPFTSKKFSRQPKKISRFHFFALLAWHLCGLWKRFTIFAFFPQARKKSFLQRLCSTMQEFCYLSCLWGIISGSNAKICGTCPSSWSFEDYAK